MPWMVNSGHIDIEYMVVLYTCDKYDGELSCRLLYKIDLLHLVISIKEYFDVKTVFLLIITKWILCGNILFIIIKKKTNRENGQGCNYHPYETRGSNLYKLHNHLCMNI